jgi:hypothetical protein
MRLRRIKIDELTVFFVLALALLYLSFGRELILPGSSAPRNQYFRLTDAVYAPSSGLLQADSKIFTYNPSVMLLVSIDGGQSFREYPGPVHLDKLRNPEITTIPTSFHWVNPAGKFPEAKSIVVKLEDKSTGWITEPSVYTYLREPSELPVIAITLPHEDLYDEKKGIMTFGQRSWIQKGFYTPWWFRQANYTGRGVEWEREACFQYFENNELRLEQFCGIRISGNATRGFPQKSLQIIARKNYGPDHFAFRFFGDNSLKKYESLVIRNSGNDNTKTLFADLLMHQLAEDAAVLTQKGRPVRVFLNGNYWGIYDLRERIDEYFIGRIEDVPETDVTILEGAYGDVKDGSEKDKRNFDSMMKKIDDAVNVHDDLLSEIGHAMDLQSFIDYIILETYYGNTDWPHNNAMWYKAGEGKWKWILNDLDYGLAYLGPGSVSVDIFDKLDHSSAVTARLFNKLWTHPSFRESFETRVGQMLETQFSPQRVTGAYEELKAVYENEMGYQVDRWRLIGSLDEWESNCQANLDFLIRRPAIYREQVRNHK